MKVFITGASSGLGAALAAHYAGRGASLGLVARRRPALEDLERRLAVPCASYAADVADAGAMAWIAADYCAQHGAPDIVIANAGVSSGTLGEEPEDIAVLERILRTNVVGLAATLTPFVAPMRARGTGTLAGIASVAGMRGLPGSGAYCASKSAAIAWLESMRLELAGSGLRISTVCPGYVKTPMTAVNRFPMPFLLDADDAARRVARAIERGSAFSVVPWQMRIVASMLRQMPDWLYDRAFAAAPRKPRKLPL